MFGANYSSVKLKVNLDLTIKRLKLQQQKHDNQGSISRKEVGKYLERNKIELAEIKTEQIIRDDYYREALEILEMYCTLLLTRFGLLDSKKSCDESLKEAVYTLLWCAPRISVDLNEINEIKKQLAARFGKEIVEEANQDDCPFVSKRVKHKLSAAAPPRHVVLGYLRLIADTYHIAWDDKWGAAPSLIDDGVPNLGGLMLDPNAKNDPYNNNNNMGGGMGGGGGGIGSSFVMVGNGSGAVGSDSKEFPHLEGLAFPPAINTPAAYPPQQQTVYPPQQQTVYPPQQQQPTVYPSTAQQPSPGAVYPPQQPRPSIQPPPYQNDVFPSVPGVSPTGNAANSFIPDMPLVPAAMPSAPTSAATSGAAGGGGGDAGADSVPDFDDLARRLNALKRR